MILPPLSAENSRDISAPVGSRSRSFHRSDRSSRDSSSSPRKNQIPLLSSPTHVTSTGTNMHQCQVCFQEADNRCGRCHKAYYCGREHSVSDWKRHKRECHVLAAGLDTQVGFPLKVKAILFPVEGGEPRIVDVGYRLEPWEETPDLPKHTPDLRPFFGNTKSWPTTIERDGFKPGATPLGRSLTLIHSIYFAEPDQPRNRCIERIAPNGFAWRNNVVVFRNTPPAERIAQFDDVTEDDLRVIRKYFEEGGDGADVLGPLAEAMRDELLKDPNVINLADLLRC
ncbi:hypothetical protein BV20DRAFT_1048574 [Pilatotrama ljubarskyi]|nr:hypothetical protein BV20DRAFT_1048574 [Pilatotrama ljubarskyi]